MHCGMDFGVYDHQIFCEPNQHIDFTVSPCYIFAPSRNLRVSKEEPCLFLMSFKCVRSSAITQLPFTESYTMSFAD